MIATLVPLMLQAALRALFAAIAVWAGLRLLGVRNVIVQKSAWGLVLVAALTMPLMPHWQGLPALAALRLPGLPLSTAAQSIAEPRALPALPAPVPASTASRTEILPREVPVRAQSHARESTAGSEDRFPAPKPSQAELGPSAYTSRPIPTPQSTASHSNPAHLRAAAVALLVYAGVFAALFLRLLFGLASAVRLWMSANPISTPDEAGPVNDIAIRSSTRVASPVNIGSGIVLPADFSEWDTEKLRVVLAHERSHIRQGDFYLQLLAGLYASLFWFSPLGWWLKRKLSELGEAISDRAGLEEAASRSSYAQLLLEFAALPRPTYTGVAMARTSHLAQRIERLLNESSFRQAFAAGGRRTLCALFLVPVALFAATTLVRVEAAASPMAQAQPVAQAETAGQATPEQIPEPATQTIAAPTAAPAPEQTPVPPAPPTQTLSPFATQPPSPDGIFAPGPILIAPERPNSITIIGAKPFMPPMPDITIRVNPDNAYLFPPIPAETIAAARLVASQNRLYAAIPYSADGEPYALVGDPGSKPAYIGHWDSDNTAEIEKARKIAHGHFLLFQRDGKSYIVDDPAVVSQVEAMNKPMDDLRDQMHALGDQMRANGEQQRELGKQMRDVSVPTPDLSKEMAELNAAVDSLKAKQGSTISQKDLGDLQREIGKIQGELGSLQGKIVMQQMNVNGGMAKFGEEQGKLGGQMGKLGAEMGQKAQENQIEIKKIIDESMKNGKAKPVE
jgi:beta-lactamase regulating signal transducer with metallopeptidase domain